MQACPQKTYKEQKEMINYQRLKAENEKFLDLISLMEKVRHLPKKANLLKNQQYDLIDL